MSEVTENSRKSHWHEALGPSGLGLTVPSVQMCRQVKLTGARNWGRGEVVLRSPGPAMCFHHPKDGTSNPRARAPPLAEAARNPCPFSEDAVCVTPQMVLPFALAPSTSEPSTVSSATFFESLDIRLRP